MNNEGISKLEQRPFFRVGHVPPASSYSSCWLISLGLSLGASAGLLAIYQFLSNKAEKKPLNYDDYFSREIVFDAGK